MPPPSCRACCYVKVHHSLSFLHGDADGGEGGRASSGAVCSVGCGAVPYGEGLGVEDLEPRRRVGRTPQGGMGFVLQFIAAVVVVVVLFLLSLLTFLLLLLLLVLSASCSRSACYPCRANTLLLRYCHENPLFLSGFDIPSDKFSANSLSPLWNVLLRKRIVFLSAVV